eukprot:TRINITY_DN46120_c0_g1_i1.p1 TRINITY_DN46120_c0_g1~~TRINITY_DN46120_c0_g1_i1.p1  ORF type:complete len:293 (-),score=35.79 TRINITY_DN46120_c0_g1_i1:226-1104(-)
MPRLPQEIIRRTILPPSFRDAQLSGKRLAGAKTCDSCWEILAQSAPSALQVFASQSATLPAQKPVFFADQSCTHSGQTRPAIQATDAFTQGFFGQHQQPSGEMPKGQNDYELSRGKIIDILSRDYPDFFERSPDFDVYDDSVSLEFGRPLEEPRTLARGKPAYCRALLTARTLGSTMIRNGSISCQVCDGRPYGCALRVHWTCRGQVWSIAGFRDFQISAVSYYSLALQAPDRSGAYQVLAYRINKHTLDIMEIHPSSLRGHLLDLIVPQAEHEPALASQARSVTAGVDGML